MPEFTPRSEQPKACGGNPSPDQKKPGTALRDKLRGLPLAEQEKLICVTDGPPEKQPRPKPTRDDQPIGPGVCGEDVPIGNVESQCEDPDGTRAAIIGLITTTLSDAVVSYNSTIARSEALAISKYIHATGGSPATSYGEAEFCKDVMDNLLGSAFGAGLKVAAAGVTGALTGVVDMLFGAATGLAWSVLKELVLKDDDEKKVHQSVVAVGKMATGAHDRIILGMDSANAVWKQTRDAAVSELRLATTVEQMTAIERWARGQLMPLQSAQPNAEAMYLGLLERWVLERAGDADSEGNGVNSESHAEAKRTLADPESATLRGGLPVTDGDKITKGDLFVDQLRFQLGRFGLASDGATKHFSEKFKLLRGKFPDAPTAIERKLQEEEFAIHETLDEAKWEHAMSLTSPRGDKHTPVPPGREAKVIVRIELDRSGGTYALDLMKLEYVSPGATYRREVEREPD